MAGFDSDPVVTSMAGFAGVPRPHPPGGRKETPAVRRYRPAVSRRTPVSRSMRRSDHPSRPRAMTCCCFFSLKTLLMRRRLNASTASRDLFSPLLAN
jgi:hypothetical protein